MNVWLVGRSVHSESLKSTGHTFDHEHCMKVFEMRAGSNRGSLTIKAALKIYTDCVTVYKSGKKGQLTEKRQYWNENGKFRRY